MQLVSPYYPPRATWVSRLRYDFKWSTARLVILGWTVALIVFLMELGRPVATFAYGAMVSLNVTGVMFLLRDQTAKMNLSNRILLCLFILFCVTQLYGKLGQRWALPVQRAGKAIVINPSATPSEVHRGDWVAYRVERRGWLIAAGLNLEPVIGVAGDRIVFHSDSITVNGVTQHRQVTMPVQGELVVPAGHWFIWPEFAGTYHNLESAMLEVATVPFADFVGRPFRHWFWRKQELP